jgi:hypothetical protein
MRAVLASIAVVAGCHIDMDTQPICDIGADGVMLVNPSTLTCEQFSQDTCNPACGPCADGTRELPSWGKCASACRELDEASCGRAPACRVARDYVAYYTGGQASTFAGCWPMDTLPESPVNCYSLDADACSRHNDCTSLYEMDRGQNPPTARFKGCAFENETLGFCFGPISCTNIKPPSCPAGMEPGVQSGCYTGACIPDQFCGVTTGGGPTNF